MVLTITVGGQDGQTVLSPNDLAQIMSGQTVTGLLNPDGSITLNSDMVSAQQLSSISTSMPNSNNNQTTTITSSASMPYTTRLQLDQQQVPQTQANSISNLNAISNHTTSDLMGQTTQQQPQVGNNSNSYQQQSNQKKTGQKRLTAKQKQVLQQQQQQQAQQQQQLLQQSQQQMGQQLKSSDNRQQQMMSSQQAIDQQQVAFGQQPQIVATVQLPNGQIGQLIAPSGGQFWSPNAINLQQLSMAVAAATGTMPQPISLPTGSPIQMSASQQQVNTSPNVQTQSINNQQQASGQQQQSLASNNSDSNQQQVMTTVQLPNGQMGQILTRPGQANQIWSSGSISLSQLSALAQQGVVQLAPVSTGSGQNGQRMMEVIPQTAFDGLLQQNGQQQLHAINSQSLDDSTKWQQQQPNSQSQSSTGQALNQSSLTITTTGASNNSMTVSRSTTGSLRQYNNSNNLSANNNDDSASTQNTAASKNSSQSNQPQRKLKRLACTCPNCRDGDSSRGNGGASDKKKQHICHFPECNKVYGKTSHLRAHLRWHSGERPYVCNWSFCGKKFTRSDELQRHKRTHTGEKRFQCNECLKRFMRSDHLSKHLKTHLSSKKCASQQQTQQLQLSNGLPTTTIVSLPQNSIPVKLEQNMIDEQLAQDTLDESDKQQFGHEEQLKFEASC